MPKKNLAHKYQSQPSIIQAVEAKTLSHRSSARSSHRSYKDDLLNKIKPKSKLVKNQKPSNRYNESSSHERVKGESSITSNSKTKSTNDTTNIQANTFMSLSSLPGSWNTSNDFAK